MSASMDTAPTDGTHFLAKWEDFETGQTIGWVETWYAVPAGKIGGWESPWEYGVVGLYGPVVWVSMSADTRLADAEAMAEALRWADETFRDLGWHAKWEVTTAALEKWRAGK